MSAAAEQLQVPPQDDSYHSDILRVFRSQQEHAVRLRSSSAAERIVKLHKLRDALVSRQEAIFRAAYADFKKPQSEVEMAELLPIFSEIKHTASHLKKWMKPKRVWPTALLFGTRTEIRYEPKGASLIISPWNYPINLSFMPLVSAIAAGCPAIIKPSEMTPNLSKLIGEIVRDTFAEEDVAVFEGDVEVSQQLLELPFDHIFFTGSPAVGKIVMAAAAKHLTSVTLELGGKSPTIIDQNVDLDRAAKSIAWGKFGNVGQTCIAPDYVLVHDSLHDEFVDKFKACIGNAYGEDPKASPDYARIVNDRHFGRVKSLIDDAVAAGAKLVHGGATDAEDNYVEPTVLTDVPENARIEDEEIFGPVLPVRRFTDIDEVIHSINAKPKPLALYYYGRDSDRAEHVLKNTSAGGGCVNQCLAQYLHMNAPFGGVNNSGIGNSHGHWGFKAFSHERTTVTNKFSATLWLAPPYTDFVKRLIAITLRTAR